ncbi:MAG: anthranilate synthase component II [Culicoidibacterales bacterium]
MILIIDNYDSNTYNIYQAIGALAQEVVVIKNDELALQDIIKLAPTHIIISPGPGHPRETGVCLDVIQHFKSEIPILGICLGHQLIGHIYKAQITHAKRPIHGKKTPIYLARGNQLFKNMPPILTVGRYHSLIISAQQLPAQLLLIAEDEYGEIMAIKHRNYNLYGVQFHPESILTQKGEQLFKNFLQMEGNLYD